MRVRTWPRAGQHHYRFDFSVSELARAGAVRDGITIDVMAFDQWDDLNLTETHEAMAYRRAAEILQNALVELRKAGDQKRRR